MTERRERHVQLTENSFRVGPSKLEWDGKKLVLEFSEITIPHFDKIEGCITDSLRRSLPYSPARRIRYRLG